MTANILMLISALIVGLLGVGHLLLTYIGPRLLPRDRALKTTMEQVPLVITNQTNMWRAWIGFNVSHSMGAILFGLFYGFMAVAHGEVLFQSWFLLSVGLIALITYVTLAKLYWFISPLLGTSISLACFIISIVLSRI